MDYWAETMQDDCYLIAADGWMAGRAAPDSSVEDKDRQDVKARSPTSQRASSRFKSDLIPAALLIARYFTAEQDAIEALEAELAAIEQQLEEMARGTRRRGRAAGRSHRRRRRQAQDSTKAA